MPPASSITENRHHVVKGLRRRFGSPRELACSDSVAEFLVVPTVGISVVIVLVITQVNGSASAFFGGISGMVFERRMERAARS